MEGSNEKGRWKRRGVKKKRKGDPVHIIPAQSLLNPIFPRVLRGRSSKIKPSTRCIWFIPASIRAPPNTITTERVRRLSTKLIEIPHTTASGTAAQARAKGFKHHCFPIGLKGGRVIWMCGSVLM